MGHRILAAVATTFYRVRPRWPRARPSRGTRSRHARVEVGAVGALGALGRVGAVRLGNQVNEKFAVDFTAGYIDGRGRDGDGAHGFSLGAQVRWLWHGRGSNGRAG